jgi:hypothetical protein
MKEEISNYELLAYSIGRITAPMLAEEINKKPLEERMKIKTALEDMFIERLQKMDIRQTTKFLHDMIEFDKLFNKVDNK